LRRAFAIAARECLRHPFRTLLVSQGILWAMVVVVAPAAIIEGSRRNAMERAGELGTDRIQIEPDRAGGERGAPREADLPPLRELLPPDGALTALRVQALNHIRAEAGEDGVREEAAWWVGVDEDHLRARGVALAEGRWLQSPEPTAADVISEFEVVLEPKIAGEIFPAGALGGRLRVSPSPLGARRAPILTAIDGTEEPPPGSVELRVVGVLAPEPSRVDRFGIEEGKSFTRVLRQLMRALGIAANPVPFLESGRGILVDRSAIAGDRLDWIILRGDPTTIGAIEVQAEERLIAAGRSVLLYTNTAWSILGKSELDGYLQLHDILFWVAIGIGLIILANLLLLAAAQRRREIALRQAEGARRGDIFRQFLAEGLLLAAIGIALGLLVGMLLAKIRADLDPSALMTVIWPWRSAAEGALIILVGALVAAAWPAWSASRHAPVELLRRAAGKVRVGGRGVLRSPGRSALLLLTYAVGFASVLAAVGTIEGGRRSIESDLSALGADVIAALNPVTVGPLTIVEPGAEGAATIDDETLDLLESSLGREVVAVIPLHATLGVVRGDGAEGGARSVVAPVIATDGRYEGVLRAGLLAGRFLPRPGEALADPEGPTVAVLDESLARMLRPQRPEGLVGEELGILRDGVPLQVEVIGIFRDPVSLRKHMTAFDGQARSRGVGTRRLGFQNIYLPYDREAVDPSGVLVQVSDEEQVEAVLARMEALFEERGIVPFLHVQKTWIEFLLEIVDRLSNLSHFVWILDLLMVVVLTATISLVSIRERYPEVALRRAEGATRLQVVWPLLGEATILGAAAAPLGALLGLGIIEFGIRPVLEWPPHLPGLAWWGTPLVVIGASWLAHLLPALRIARLDPGPVLSRHSGA